MDIPCPRCTEPWDVDTFFSSKNPRALYRLFRGYGCAALVRALEGETYQLTTTCEQTADGKTIRALMDVAGDEVGDVAVEIEDFKAVGLL